MSTDHQSLTLEGDALAAAGGERVFTDQLSEGRADRPGLVAMLDDVRAGDIVVVVAVNRLGRSLSGVVATLEASTGAGVLLRSLREGIDCSTPRGGCWRGSPPLWPGTRAS